MPNLAGFIESKEYAHSGMIDWLTLKICLTSLPSSVIHKLRSHSSTLCKISPAGEIEWTTYCFESVKTDTHQVCVRIGAELWIQGSPARVGLPNNVFGSLDVVYCAQKMIHFAQQFLELDSLPPVTWWDCTRIDVTRNYIMQSEPEAREALNHMKQAPESRQKHSFESHGFYIGKGSTMHQGKVYLKGQDAKRNQKSGRAEYTNIQLEKAQKLLRAEYMIRRHRLARLYKDHSLKWHQLNPELLLKLHTEYFQEYFSTIEITDMSNILERLNSVAPTQGQAEAAYDCYVRIRMMGYEQAKASFTKPSWYRHIKHLKAAGFSRSDLNSVNTIPLRKRAIDVGQPARHWDDIRMVAA